MKRENPRNISGGFAVTGLRHSLDPPPLIQRLYQRFAQIRQVGTSSGGRSARGSMAPTNARANRPAEKAQLTPDGGLTLFAVGPNNKAVILGNTEDTVFEVSSTGQVLKYVNINSGA